jgi:hypothetical protein
VLLRDGNLHELSQACAPGLVSVEEIVVPDRKVTHMHRLKRLPGECTYTFYNRKRLGMPEQPFSCYGYISSADGLFSDDGATFSGSRIACLDAGSGHSRLLSQANMHSGWMWRKGAEELRQSLCEKLAAEGIQIVPYPHIEQKWGKWRSARSP